MKETRGKKERKYKVENSDGVKVATDLLRTNRVSTFEVMCMHTLLWKVDAYMGRLAAKLTREQALQVDIRYVLRIVECVHCVI